MEKESVIKYVIQYLNERGLKEVSSKLEVESNVYLESEEIKMVKQDISEDKIDDAILQLSIVSKNGHNLNQKSDTCKPVILGKLIIFKIFNLIKSGNNNEALKTIRQYLTLINDESTFTDIKKCAQLIFIKDQTILNETMEDICKEAYSKQNLIQYIDNLIISRETELGIKLETILEFVLKHQIKYCRYHNTTENKFSYFFDHSCPKEIIPTKCVNSIEHYNEEITNIVYSNSFKYFAIVLKGNNIAIFKINKYMNFIKQSSNVSTQTTNDLVNAEKNFTRITDYNKRISLEVSLVNTIIEPHKNQITALQWSLTDQYILTASKDKLIRLFDAFTGKRKLNIEGHDGMVSSAIFVQNDKKILSSGLDYKISLWSLEGNCEFSLSVPNVTISELLFSVVLNLVIVISATTNSILFYDIDTKQELDKIPMNDVIVSSSISKLDKGGYILVNSSKATPVLNLINLRTKEIERKFFGHRQERFTNKCSFGGENENFLLCGSDDAKIYVWNRNHSIPVFSIKAHSAPVNAVIWSHSHLTDIIISCSEDHTIKILANDSVDKISIDLGINLEKSKKPLESKIITIEGTRENGNNINVNNLGISSSVTNMISRLGNLIGSTFQEDSDNPDEEN